jgi:hypothetical protein
VFTIVGFAGESATDRAERIGLEFMNRAQGRLIRQRSTALN